MKAENIFTAVKKPAFVRRIGVLFFVLAIASVTFAYFGADYFAYGDFQLKIIYISTAVFLGILFTAGGGFLIFSPDRKLEIDPATQKIFLTEKLIRTKFEEFSFADVERTDFYQHDLENGTIYEARIIMRGGRIIDVPSENSDDEKPQAEILERVRNLLAK